MASNPFIRVIVLIRLRWPLALVCGFLMAIFSAIAGVVSPYLWESQALVEIIDPEANKDSVQVAARGRFGANNENRLYHQALRIATSNVVFAQVIEELKKSELDAFLAFPKRFSVTDIRRRVKIASRHLSSGERSVDKIVGIKKFSSLSDIYLSEAIDEHLTVRGDPNSSTVEFTYLSAEPGVSKKICTLLVKSFLNVLDTRERKRLEHSSESLDKRIKKSFSLVEEKEQETQKLLLDFPELEIVLAGGRKANSELSPYTRIYLNRLERLTKVERELAKNERILKRTKRLLARDDAVPEEISKNLRSQVVKEIAEQEYRKLSLLVIRKQDEDSPSVQTVERRLRTLRKLLNTINQREIAQDNSYKLIPSYQTLVKQNQVASQEYEKSQNQVKYLKKQVEESREKMNPGLKAYFKLKAQLREIDSVMGSIRLMLDQKKENDYKILTLRNFSKVLIEPTTPLYSVTLSVQKRIAFSAVIGVFVGIFLIIVYDLVQPSFLVEKDLKNFNFKYRAGMELTQTSVADAVVDIQSLRLPVEGRPPAILVTSTTVGFNFMSWFMDVAKVFVRKGEKIAVLRVGIPGVHNIDSGVDNLLVEVASPKSLAFNLQEKLNTLRSDYDRIFVVQSGILNSSLKTLLARHTDATLVLSKLGKSRISEIDALKELSTENFRSPYHFFVFNY